MVLQFSFGDPKVVHDVPVEKPWSTGHPAMTSHLIFVILNQVIKAQKRGKRGGGQNSQYYVTSFMEDPTNQKNLLNRLK